VDRGIAGIVCGALVLSMLAGAASVPTIAPIRPPAVPLFVRSPYLSVWSASDLIAARDTTFWTGAAKPLRGALSVDGHAYRFIGLGRNRALHQVSLRVSATQSVYVLRGAGVTMTLDFLSPVDASDIRRLSVPFAYLFASVRNDDARPHRIDVSFEPSNDWTAGSPIGGRWTTARIAARGESLVALSVSPALPHPLSENSDYPGWGTFIFAALDSSGVTTTHLGATGAALQMSLGRLEPHSSASDTLMVGAIRNPAVSYLGKPLPALWRSYWTTWQQMALFAAGDAAAARVRADRFDAELSREATRAGGAQYAALCALSFRQAFGSVELVGTSARPWMFLKELSSDGNVSSVDVVYPAFPAYAYANPELLRLLLEPLLDYAEHGGWPKRFAEHDIGSSYPDARGHNDGKEEDMPVEESANMLLMAAAYARAANRSHGAEFARRHYRILKRWADYNVANAVDPAYQNQTDDFTGFIKSSANLALKGILSVGAMAQVAQAAGHQADAIRYSRTARAMMARWAVLARSRSGDHLVLAYGRGASWSLKYNAFPDVLLGLHLIPRGLLAMDARYYLRYAAPFGIALDNRHTYTKADWELWTAAATDDARLREVLFDGVYRFANLSRTRTPLSDWYDTITGEPIRTRSSPPYFTARPVMGGALALLLRYQEAEAAKVASGQRTI